MIRPLGDRVVVEPKQSDEKTKAGIIIPASAQNSLEAIVVATGPGTSESPMSVREGQTVLFKPDAGIKVTDHKKEVIILSLAARDIVAIKNEDSLIPLPGFAYVKTNFDSKSVLTHGSLTLYLDTSWLPEQHAVDFGEIVSLPEKYDGLLKLGDIVYGNHLFIRKENEFQKQDADSIVLVEESQVYCYIREGEIIPMPDKLLIEPIIDGDALPSWLHNPFLKRKERMGKILYVPKGETKVKPGQIIVFRNHANYQFEINGKPFECLRAVSRQLDAVYEPND